MGGLEVTEAGGHFPPWGHQVKFRENPGPQGLVSFSDI